MAKKAELYFVKKNNRLEPSSPFDQEMLDQIPEGAEVRVDKLVRRRSDPMQRKYWACLNEVVKATACSPTPEALHRCILISLGYVTPTFAGENVIYVPDSTSYDKMDQTEFFEYVKRADLWCLESLGVGLMEDA